MKTEPAIPPPPLPARAAEPSTLISPYASAAAFEAAQRMAKSLAASTMVPPDYRNSVANCLVAMELANRIGASVLAVMQNADVIQGRPSWRASFVISAINTCGKFEPLRFRLEGEGDDRWCQAWTVDRNGQPVEGPVVSIGMAKAEGWHARKGSKWQTMPEIMLRYRAAAFFGRLYAPEVLMGMQTSEEAHDAIPLQQDEDGTFRAPGSGGVEGLKSAIQPADPAEQEPAAAAADGPPARDAEALPWDV